MIPPSSPIANPGRPRRRRSTRLRATVEALDARRLMAAGVVATPIDLFGNAGIPLRVYQPVSPINHISAILTPVGTPVPVARLVGDPGATLAASSYTGTVDWGDGTPVDAARFGTLSIPYLGFSLPNFLSVAGPEHTYARPGTYAVTVTVVGPGDVAPTIIRDTADIGNYPAVEGHLDPASDTGFPADDAVTADRTPTYTGTTQPGARVRLLATASSATRTTTVGTVIADASGAWSITAKPLRDGAYNMSVEATNAAGLTATNSLDGLSYYYRPLIVDTVGPKIAGFRVVDPGSGSFQVTYANPDWLLVAPTLDPGHYVIARAGARPRAGRGVVSPTISLVDTSYGVGVTAAPTVVVAGTLPPGALAAGRNGTYTLTIRAAGIVGISGVALDGESRGRFPTGNGRPGGDFRVKIVVRAGRVVGPAQILAAGHHARA